MIISTYYGSEHTHRNLYVKVLNSVKIAYKFIVLII